jgi:hypothetical protein
MRLHFRTTMRLAEHLHILERAPGNTMKSIANEESFYEIFDRSALFPFCFYKLNKARTPERELTRSNSYSPRMNMIGNEDRVKNCSKIG